MNHYTPSYWNSKGGDPLENCYDDRDLEAPNHE